MPLLIEVDKDGKINHEALLSDIVNDYLGSVESFQCTALNDHRLRICFEVET